MAPAEERTTAQVRREIEVEREQLARAVSSLRHEMGITARIRSRLPLAAVGALGVGFVLAGGIGATMRFHFRRGRAR